MYSQTLPHLLKTVRAPALVVWGENDKVVPMSAGKRYAEALPNARLEIVKALSQGEVSRRDLFLLLSRCEPMFVPLEKLFFGTDYPGFLYDPGRLKDMRTHAVRVVVIGFVATMRR